ncbi:hypothetical protein LJ756_13135 [Arthrobacter sp. zg-Y411]|uniref:hypothetical protein n=1 Tax=Arthrobacter zhangbolii TaxID=2886936 RepID=UPI001D1558BB|nr:hypothetical protein [Arthrobacter zhangbolii]MCC3295564.1 hypothetical protein [Arthrobacter zhangbolii]
MSDIIEWTCDVCGRAIEDGEGYLTVDESKVKEIRRQVGESNSGYPRMYGWQELMDRPDFVKWQALHGACDPRSESGDYSIEVERIRTARHALGWTLQLHGKNWTGATDWNSFIGVRADATMDHLRA